MTEFLQWFDGFMYGLVIGIIARPAFVVLTKIIQEVKIAKQQWRKPR
jgi:hypothetical protein